MSEICVVETVQDRVRPRLSQIFGHRRAHITHVSSDQYLHDPLSWPNPKVPPLERSLPVSNYPTNMQSASVVRHCYSPADSGFKRGSACGGSVCCRDRYRSGSSLGYIAL